MKGKIIVIVYMLFSVPIISYSQTASQLDSFLLKPFDLQKFKKVKGGSNSGGATKQSYYYKPLVKGMYYGFFLFPPSKGFIGDREFDTESSPKNGLRIVTYKPLGRYENDYLDPTETLIEVVQRFNDKDLPELAFIGIDTLSVRKRLGAGSFKKDNYLVYTRNNNALILELAGDRIIWLKYVRLNFPLTKSNIPEGLLED